MHQHHKHVHWQGYVHFSQLPVHRPHSYFFPSIAFKSTLIDLLTLPFGGWQRISTDISTALKASFPSAAVSNDLYMGYKDFFDAKLLLAAPVSLIRYPLALLIKAPIAAVPLTLLLYATYTTSMSSYQDTMMSMMTTSSLQDPEYPGVILSYLLESLTDVLITGVIVALELTVLSRILLIAILQERNVVLADNIRRECQRLLLQRTNASPDSRNWFEKLINVKPTTRQLTLSESSKEKVIIAVLGMAHCNGVKKLLTEREN